MVDGRRLDRFLAYRHTEPAHGKSVMFGLKGFSEAPYIWIGIILILVGTVVWIYGDKLHGAL